MSQESEIREALQRGDWLTSLSALYEFGCLRLGARVYDLRRQGIDIKSKLIQVGDGKHVALYWIEQPKKRRSRRATKRK